MRHCPPERPRCVRVARPHAQGVGRAERSARPDAERAHELSAAPASRRTARRSLVDAVRGAGQLRRRPAERPRRVRVERQQAQGLERVDRHLPPDAARSRGLCAAPASRRTARRSLVDAARGAGLVRRRHVERPRRVRVGRPHGHGVGRFERRVPQDTARAHWLRAAPASCQTKRPSNQGRRSPASPSCRTAALCPGRGTARSGCGEGRPASAVGRCADTRATRGAGVQSNRVVIARRRRKGRRYFASSFYRTTASCRGRRTAHSGSGTRRAVGAYRR